MGSWSRKWLSLLTWMTGLAASCGLALFALQVYRAPMEMMTALLRIGMLLFGAREAICDLDGLPLHYYRIGRSGPPMILLHGLGSSAEVWTSLLPFLARRYVVYALDLPGFGKTPLAPEGVNVRTHVLYLKRFLDALDYPQVTLVGNSFGGWIATHFAAQFPERVQHLYLLNSAGLRREETNSPYSNDRATARRSMRQVWGSELPLPGFLLDDIVRGSQMPAYANFIKGYDAREELDSVLPQVRTPTTIIWGTRDSLFPLACAHDFHASIANSELYFIDGVGHIPHFQAPMRVARILLACR